MDCNKLAENMRHGKNNINLQQVSSVNNVAGYRVINDSTQHVNNSRYFKYINLHHIGL